MSKHHRVVRILLGSMIAALAASAALASAASASPEWKFAGTPLSGSETITGSATASTLTLPGITTTCDFAYKATIFNSAGIAKGEITSMSLTKCSTNGVCTVTSATADALPWPIRGKTVSGSNYLIVEGIKFSILYGDPECVLDETTVAIKGSAGALFDNTSSTFAFSPASFTATGTKLSAFGTSVNWTGVFSTGATGLHKGQALTLS